MKERKKMISDIVVFILTHARAEKVITYKTLRNHGYTGKIYIVIDNEDPQIEQYKKYYGDDIIIFNKNEAIKKTDDGDNFHERRGVVYARNAIFEIAESLGIEYLFILDDDYTSFNFRYGFNKNKKFVYVQGIKIKNLDNILTYMLEYYKSVPALSIAMAQGGDFIGGRNNGFVYGNAIRKCMNSFICSVHRKFQFLGRINEDTTAYVNHGNRGKIFQTIPTIALEQIQTQANIGGMTELYLDHGTYIKSFYTVMYNPASVKVAVLNTKNSRLHHKVSWDNTVPKIISESYRKNDNSDTQETSL